MYVWYFEFPIEPVDNILLMSSLINKLKEFLIYFFYICTTILSLPFYKLFSNNVILYLFWPMCFLSHLDHYLMTTYSHMNSVFMLIDTIILAPKIINKNKERKRLMMTLHKGISTMETLELSLCTILPQIM